MFKRIDQSSALARFIEYLSSAMAKQRGLPVVIGVGLVIVSFVLQVLGVYFPSRTVELLAVVTQNVGILVALIGLLLAEPLGR